MRQNINTAAAKVAVLEIHKQKFCFRYLLLSILLISVVAKNTEGIKYIEINLDKRES